MPSIPSGLIHLLEQVEEKNISSVCSKVCLTETAAYKSYSAKVAKKNCEKEFLINTFAKGGDIQGIYKAIEPFLFIGGCAPGVGIAFNIIDACFCAALGNWVGAAVAIVSCFPIPGFKVLGKGLEKSMSTVLKEIAGKLPAASFLDGMGLLRRQLTRIGLLGIEKQGLHTIKPVDYSVIQEQLERMFEGWNSPFAEKMLKDLFKVLFNAEEKGIKFVSSNIEDLSMKYGITPRNITEFGSLLIK